MNKFLTRIVGATLGFAMAVGVSTGIASSAKPTPVYAADSTTTMTWGGTETQWSFSDSGSTYLEWTHNSTGTSPIQNDDYRMYSGADLTVRAKSSYTSSIKIKSLAITGASSKNSNVLYYNATTGAKVTSDGTGVTTLTWSTSTATRTADFGDGLASVTVARATSGNQVRVTSILVTYEYTPASVVQATSMSISPAGPINAVVGQTVTFTPTLNGGSGNYEKTIEWASSNTSVVAKPDDSEDGETVSVSVLAVGSTTITGTVTNPGSASSSIVINAKDVSSIAVTTAPTNTTYDEGDSFDPTGMVVTATYSDSSTADVTSSCTFTPDPLTENTTEVTISYGGQTTTQAVTVNPLTEVTFVYATDDTDELSISKCGITMTVSNGTWATNAQNAYKVFKGATLVISSASKHFDKIEFTCTATGTSQYGPGSFGSGAPTGYTYETSGYKGTWTGDSTSVTFTATSNQVRMTQVYIRYKSTLPSVELNSTSISLVTAQTSGVTVEATVHNVATPSYSWTANNGNVTLEDEDTDTVTIIPVSAGTSTVTLTVGGVSPTLTATVSVSISEPYTVAQAATAIAAADDDIQNIYVRGTISQIDSVDLEYKNATYWISDDGTTQDHFKVYRGKYIDGADFTATNQIAVGDVVTLYCNLSKSHSNIDTGSSIVSLVPVPRVNSISLTPSSVTVEPNASGDIIDLFTNISINQDAGSNKTANDIVWSTDDEEVFYIDGGEYIVAGEHRESTTIRASIGDVEYASATINVIDSSIYSISYNLAVEWVVVTDPSTLVAGDHVILTGVKNDVTYAATTYSSGNNVPADTEHTLTVNGNKVTGVVSTMVYTLEAGNVTNSVAFKDSAGKYLYAASSGSNYMKTQASIDDNASFILGSDSSVLAQGTNTHNAMRYNITSNLFSCYVTDSETGSVVTFYKRVGGQGTVDVPSLAMYATISARETVNGNTTTVSSASLRFGASISIANWNAIDSNCPITDYGVMCLKRTTLDSYQGINTVKEAYEDGRTVTNLHKCSNDRPFAVPYSNNGNYIFTVRIDVNDPASYTTSIVAAPYILAGGHYYFLGEMEYSVRSLAQHYLDDNTLEIALSNSALRVLAGN